MTTPRQQLQNMRIAQRKLTLQQALQVLDHAGASATRSQQAIELAMLQIRKLITGLPDGLLREPAWRALKPEITRALERMSLAIGRDLVLEAATMVPEQAMWAANYLTTGMAGDAPGAAALRRATTGENNPFAPRTVEDFPGATYTAADLGRVGANPELLGQLQQRVPPQVMTQVQAMRIEGSTLQRWFGSSVILQDETTGQFVTSQGLGGRARDLRGAPRFAQFSFKSIDRNVRAGFISGLTNEQIAQNLIADEIRGHMRLGQGVVRLKSDARAIARTGLAHLAEEVHQTQWQSMYDTDYSYVDSKGVRRWPGRELQDAMKWRWDASNDSRTCPSCSSLDQKTVSKREQLPSIPLHVQCRCAVLPVTATQQAMEAKERREWARDGGRPITGVELTVERPPKQGPKEPRAAYLNRMGREGWYATQGRGPSGERYWRRRVEGRAPSGESRVSDYLGLLVNRRSVDPIGSATTLQEYFGGGPGGAKRATVFSRLITQRNMDPHDALQQLFRSTGDEAMRKLVPVKDLAKLYPDWAEALEQVQPIRSVRQAKRIAAGKPMGRPRRGY